MKKKKVLKSLVRAKPFVLKLPLRSSVFFGSTKQKNLSVKRLVKSPGHHSNRQPQRAL